MMNWKKLLFTLLFVITLLSSAAVLEAVKAQKAPKIDGKLDDDVWKNALKFDKFTIHKKSEPGLPTTAYLLYSRNYIYAGFRCELPPGTVLTVSSSKDKINIAKDDSVELMIDANRTNDRYVHFIINPDGAYINRLCAQGGIVGNTRWNSEITVKTFKGENFWSAEIKVPLYTLDLMPDGNTWSFNFCRNSCKPRQSSSAANGAFNNSGSFIPVSGFDFNLKERVWTLNKPKIKVSSAQNKLQINTEVLLINPLPQKRTIKFSQTFFAKLADGSSGGIFGNETTLTFLPNEKKNVIMLPVAVDKEGDYKCSFAIKNAYNGKVLKRNIYFEKISCNPLTIKLIQPHYRNAVFASQKLKKIQWLIKTSLPQDELKKLDFQTTLKSIDGKIIFSKKLDKPGLVEISADKLDYGKFVISAKILDKDKTVAEAVQSLQKLPPCAGEMYLDAQGFWRRDGKRIFPLVLWADDSIKGGDASYMETKDLLRVDAVHAWGYGEIGKMKKATQLTEKDRQLIRRITEKHMKNPKLMAYFLCDEPGLQTNPSSLRQRADIIRETDPYHPLMFNSYGLNEDFLGIAEIDGLHPYPPIQQNKKRNMFGKVVAYLNQFKEYPNPPCLFYFNPGYNNADCGSFNSRVYTFDEYRTEYLIALAAGVRGLTFYVWNGIHYPELYIGVNEFIKELNALKPILLTDDYKVEGLKSSNKKVQFLVKKHDNDFWIFAHGASEGKETAVLTVPGLNGRELYVFRTKRKIKAENNKFKDSFTNFDARIYTTCKDNFGLKTLEEVEAEIAAVHAKRKKQGNLAYQRYEHEKLKISASSNKINYRRKDIILFHVTDGVCEGKISPKNHGSGGCHAWQSEKVKAQTPEWLELTFPSPVKASKIAVYGAENTLCDYELQAFVDGSWKKLGEVKNAKDNFKQITFPMVKSTRFRIFITKVNGDRAKLHEIEIY